jgi:hypothetical protein
MSNVSIRLLSAKCSVEGQRRNSATAKLLDPTRKLGNPFVALFRARLFRGSHLLPWHLTYSKNALVALGRLRGLRRHEAQHLLFQLRIHLVRDRHYIGKQRTEFQILHVSVQRCKNGDLQ